MRNAYQMKLGPIELLSRPGRISARVECTCCGVHDEWNLTKVPEPAIVKRHFTVRGWELRRAPKCPDCQMKKRERQVSNQKTTTIPAGTPEPSEAAKRAKRMIYMALEDYYDENKKCYKNGKTDKEIAEEVGSSEAFVRQIREADFGPINLPFTAIDFAIAVGHMASEVDQLATHMETVVASMHSLITCSRGFMETLSPAENSQFIDRLNMFLKDSERFKAKASNAVGQIKRS